MYIEDRLAELEKRVSDIEAKLLPQNSVITSTTADTEDVAPTPKRGRPAKKRPEFPVEPSEKPLGDLVEPAPAEIPAETPPTTDIMDDLFESVQETSPLEVQITLEEFAQLVKDAIASPKGGKQGVLNILGAYGYKGGKLSENFPADKYNECAAKLRLLL